MVLFTAPFMARNVTFSGVLSLWMIKGTALM